MNIVIKLYISFGIQKKAIEVAKERARIELEKKVQLMKKARRLSRRLSFGGSMHRLSGSSTSQSSSSLLPVRRATSRMSFFDEGDAGNENRHSTVDHCSYNLMHYCNSYNRPCFVYFCLTVYC